MPPDTRLLRLTELLTSQTPEVFSQGLELLRAVSSPPLLGTLLEGEGAPTLYHLLTSIYRDEDKATLRTELLAQLHAHAGSLRPRRLRLGYLKLPADTLHRLLSSMDLSALVELDLRYSDLGPAGAERLFSDELLSPGLSHLYLQHNGLDASTMRLLTRCPALWTLRLLDLRYNPIGADGAKVLAGAGNLGALQTLRLYTHDISPEGATFLADGAALPLAIRRSWRR